MRAMLILMMVFLLPSLAAAEQSFPELLAGAERGEGRAMLATGLAYYLGDGVERDCYEARRWLKNAAETNEVEALYTLGTMDDEGSCGIAQAERAAEFYRQAADKGHAGARYRLGELYRTGRGVDPDPVLALKWLELAAGQGEPRSYCSLARFYLKGGEVMVNRQKGLRWLRKGLASRNDEAVQLCRDVQAEAGL